PRRPRQSATRAAAPSRGTRTRGAAGRSTRDRRPGSRRAPDAVPGPGTAAAPPRVPQAVVAVEVAQADPGHVGGADTGLQHLPLGALTRVEQQALTVPAQEVSVMSAGAGRYLARGSEHHQLTHRNRPPPAGWSAGCAGTPRL